MALMFKRENSARDEIVAKRASLVKSIEEAAYIEKQANVVNFTSKRSSKKLKKQRKQICREERNLKYQRVRLQIGKISVNFPHLISILDQT